MQGFQFFHKRIVRTPILGVAHAIVFATIFLAALSLRFEFLIPERVLSRYALALPVVLIVKLLSFYFSGSFYGWRHRVTFPDFIALARATVISLLLIVMIDHYLLPHQLSRSVLIVDSLLTLLTLGILRAGPRLFHEQLTPFLKGEKRRNALLLASDLDSALLASQINSHSTLEFRVRGLIDAAGKFNEPSISGIPVLGAPRDIRRVADKFAITDLLVMRNVLTGPELRELMDLCEEISIAVRILPEIDQIFSGGLDIPVRDINITDLLRRDPVELDSALIGEMLQGRTVVVTGAGGSIGSEICRQVMKFNPRKLILLGRGENRIFQVHAELRRLEPVTELVPMIADVNDATRIRNVFQTHQPDVVYHAAAHKHVPLMEADVYEAIKNNVLGTRTVARVAHESGTSTFVMISTDKAVNPSSVMGTSKHLAERYVCAMSHESETRFVVVRFGNVLGSNGSVVPRFQEQIRRGGPITITDKRMERFFMSIPEASQLVLQAGAMADGGQVYVLDMGEPVKIVDLARDLIRLSGLKEGTIEIVFTGQRPGEKLYEELHFDDEGAAQSAHDRILAVWHRPFDLLEVETQLDDLQAMLQGAHDNGQLKARLQLLVPEYQPDAIPVSIPAGR